MDAIKNDEKKEGAAAPESFFSKKKEFTPVRTFLAAGCVTVVLWLLLSIVWDFYFDLNDDVLMKDILSGGYTGSPSAWNIQMLWPISALISRLYYVFRDIDAYGLVLLLLQALSFTLILFRTLRIQQRAKIAVWMQVISAASMCLPFGVMALYHTVFVQYSVTCAFLSSAAAFLFMTMDLPGNPEEDGYGKKFILACLPSIVLLAVSYPLRSEMTLLMMPLVLSAALFRYIQVTVKETGSLKSNLAPLFDRTGLLSILTVLVILVAVLAGESILDSCLCSSNSWQRFRNLFDARTNLYDYYGAPPVPDYDENTEYYAEIGLNRSEVALFDNYNYGLDDSITDETMSDVAQLAKAVQKSRSTFGMRMSDASWNYRNSLVSPDYAPYNILTAAGYLLLFITALSELLHRSFRQKNLLVVYRARREFFTVLFSLFFLFLVRTALWMYILYGGRFPERITHSLFMVEFSVLAGLLLMQGMKYTIGDNEPASWSIDIFAAQIILIGAAILLMPAQVRKTNTETRRRAEVNAPFIEYLNYCAAHPDNFYFTDVYSTVSFSEKMFGEYPEIVTTDASGKKVYRPDNHDLCGGWAMDSPLYEEKLAEYGYTDMKTALTDSGNAYLVIEKNGSMDWLTDWYEETLDEKVEAKKVDSIGDSFDVYRIVKK